MKDASQDSDEPRGFLSRWSRRKSLERQGAIVPAGPAQATSEGQPKAQSAAAVAGEAPPAAAVLNASTPPAPKQQERVEKPALTLQDVEQLTPESDFSAFARPDVDPAVRNAAMKKLFHADPHFNVMDGLDVYIDDYNTPDPLPKAIMRTMLQARVLGLLDDELKDQDKPEPDPPPPMAAPLDTSVTHENIDLQLQSDDAAGRGGFAQGPHTEPTDGGPAGQRPDNRADDPKSPI
jgi:Protein of unknown function (DUF3306)